MLPAGITALLEGLGGVPGLVAEKLCAAMQQYDALIGQVEARCSDLDGMQACDLEPLVLQLESQVMPEICLCHCCMLSRMVGSIFLNTNVLV